MFNMTKIMIEAHAYAKADHAYDPSRSYAYYLGLQMRNGYAEARIAITGMAPGFTIVEPKRIWA